MGRNSLFVPSGFRKAPRRCGSPQRDEPRGATGRRTVQLKLIAATSSLRSDRIVEAIAAPVVRSGVRGPGVVKELLPVVARRTDRFELLGVLLKSDRYRPPDVASLNLEGLAQQSILVECLRQLAVLRPKFREDAELVRGVRSLARTSVHAQVYTFALIGLEKSGEPLGFFKGLLLSAPEEKRALLRTVVRRIERGQRLSYPTNSEN